MKIAREIAGLSITAVLLSQCGCSASSFRNLFAKNHRSDFHTLEELDAKDSSKTAETAAATKPAEAKTATWNPFKRESQAVETPAESAATTASTGSGFWKNPFGGNDSAGTDPFLPAGGEDPATQSDVKTADAESDREGTERAGKIARTAGTLDTESDASDMSIEATPRRSAEEKSVLTAAELEVAEPLILRSEEQPVADSRTEFEKQKIMELEDLLASGDLRKTARRARETAAKAGEQAESELSRTKGAITEKTATTAAKARSVARKGTEEFDDFFGELEAKGNETAQQMADAVTEYSEAGEVEPEEVLLPSSVRKSRKDLPASAGGDNSDGRSRRQEATGPTRDAEELFADSEMLPKPGKSASQNGRKVKFADVDETAQSDFQWQSSRKPAENKSEAPSSDRVRQVSMMDDAGEDAAESETDNWLQDEIFAPKPASKLPAKTVSASGDVTRTASRHRGQTAADPFVSGEMDDLAAEEPKAVPVPAATGAPEANAEDSVSEAVLPGEMSLEEQAVAKAPSGRQGLSARSWLAIVAGLTIVGFLFLPARRKTAV